MTTEPKDELAATSDALLAELAHLRETEAQRRQEPISTAPFHALADEVTRSSERVYRIAHRQDTLGDEIPTGDDSIEDVEAASSEAPRRS